MDMEFFDIINFKTNQQIFNFSKIYEYAEIQDRIIVGKPERIIKLMRVFTTMAFYIFLEFTSCDDMSLN